MLGAITKLCASSSAACKPSYQTEELEKALQEYDVDMVVRVAIMADVRKRVAERIAHDAIHNTPPKSAANLRLKIIIGVGMLLTLALAGVRFFK